VSQNNFRNSTAPPNDRIALMRRILCAVAAALARYDDATRNHSLRRVSADHDDQVEKTADAACSAGRCSPRVCHEIFPDLAAFATGLGPPPVRLETVNVAMKAIAARVRTACLLRGHPDLNPLRHRWPCAELVHIAISPCESSYAWGKCGARTGFWSAMTSSAKNMTRTAKWSRLTELPPFSRG